MTFDEQRKQIGEWLKGPHGAKLWDLMCALRGPDSPSERGGMSTAEHSRAYAGRRKRKYATVEVVRQKAFHGVVGGCARHHDDDHITLPPMNEWDHFDHHMQRVAAGLGLKVVISQDPSKKGSVEVGRE